MLFTHAFVIAEGGQQNEPIVILTLNQCPVGLMGVFVFFSISGFLVTQSWMSTPAILLFLAKRALRIFPGLIVCLLFCAVVVGPTVTTLSMSAYFRSSELTNFFYRNILLEAGDYRLPGVLFVDNAAGVTVDGSLWTLRYEVMMYLMLALLGSLRLLRLSVALLLLVLGVAALRFETWLDPFGDLGEAAWFLGFFAGGMAAYFLRDAAWLDWRAALMGAAGLVISTWLHLLITLFPIFGTLLAMSFARHYWPAFNAPRRWGDLSYGLYIYGWPIEAWVAHWGGGSLTWWQVLVYALPLTTILAWLSWHLVEKHAIRLGGRLNAMRSAGPVASIIHPR